MSRGRPTIAFDFSDLDQLNLGNGQYRYCTDLINGLAALGPDKAFVVLGSRETPATEIAGAFHRPGWRYVHVRQSERPGSYYLSHASRAWLLRRHGVDLLHAPHTLLPLLSFKKAIVTVYDMMSELFPEYKARVASRPYRMFKYAVQRKHPHVIAISKTTADDLHRLWSIPMDDISVVPLCLSPSQQRPEDATPFPTVATDAKTVILSPFNLEPRKNLGVLLDAMAQVRRIHPDAHLVLYGRAAITPEREFAFEQAVDRLGIRDAVTRAGFVPEAQMASLYRHAALFVFPSLYEGFGLPVLEAMAAGTCTIALDQSAMAEVLGETGAKVAGDARGMAAAMSALLSDPGRRARLGRSGQIRAQTFTAEAMARRTLAAYDRVLERPI